MKLRHTTDDKYIFYCIGCKCHHGFNKNWTFDGNIERPTVSPSLLTTGGMTCHLFITQGKLVYLNDCFHELAGQTVEMQDI